MEGQSGGLVVRNAIALLSFVAVLPLVAELTPEVRLQSGVIAFRAQDYASAEPELAAAALALQERVTPGSAAMLDYERALVYLALTQFRLGREDDARATIQRLLAAETIDPVYRSLPLPAEVADFDVLVAALAPDAGLPHRGAASPKEANAPLPPVTAVPTQAPSPAPPVRSAAAPVATAVDSEQFTALRQADALAEQGQSMEAMRIWQSLTAAAGTPREVLIECAIGLYRIGAWRQALTAFDRLGPLGRGEEDLRYYHAVVLYETGNFEQARHEFDCALPFIQPTDDVERYRLKIHQPST